MSTHPYLSWIGSQVDDNCPIKSQEWDSSQCFITHTNPNVFHLMTLQTWGSSLEPKISFTQNLALLVMLEWWYFIGTYEVRLFTHLGQEMGSLAGLRFFHWRYHGKTEVFHITLHLRTFLGGDWTLFFTHAQEALPQSYSRGTQDTGHQQLTHPMSPGGSGNSLPSVHLLYGSSYESELQVRKSLIQTLTSAMNSPGGLKTNTVSQFQLSICNTGII